MHPSRDRITFFDAASSRTALPAAPSEHYPKVQERQLNSTGSDQDWRRLFGDHLLAAPSTVGLRQTE